MPDTLRDVLLAFGFADFLTVLSGACVALFCVALLGGAGMVFAPWSKRGGTEAQRVAKSATAVLEGLLVLVAVVYHLALVQDLRPANLLFWTCAGLLVLFLGYVGAQIGDFMRPRSRGRA